MQKHFFIFLICTIVCFLQASMTDEQLSHLGYNQSRKNIKNSLQLFHGWGVKNDGHFKISNPIKTRVLTCFAGKHTTYNQEQCIKNPLSMLDLNKNEDKSYKQIDELNNDTPVSAIHLLAIKNELFPVVGHNKSIYLFTEQKDLPVLSKEKEPGYYLSIFNEPSHALTKTTIIFPQLLENDTIHTIDSCQSHLIAISSKGCITTWAIEEDTISTSTMKNINTSKSFFSCAINQQEKTIFLGLNNGKIFVANILNLEHNAIISVLSGGKINWINSYADKILFCALCDCSTAAKDIENCTSNCNHGDKNVYTCDNKHILLSASQITPANNNRNLNGTSFLDNNDVCPKAIYLLGDDTAIVQRTICHKNVDSIANIEDHKEDVALISTNKITPKPPALYTAYLHLNFLKFFGGYPIHIITQESNFFIMRQSSSHKNENTTLETNTSFFKKDVEIKRLNTVEKYSHNTQNISLDQKNSFVLPIVLVILSLFYKTLCQSYLHLLCCIQTLKK